MYEEKVIYIIGNGFDKHHRLNTSYENYKSYLQNVDPFLVERFDYYLDLKCIQSEDINKWSELEVYLGDVTDFDYDEIIDEAFSSSETDIERSSYWHDPEYNVDEISKDLINIMNGIKSYFPDWIYTIEQDIVNKVADSNLIFPSNSLFLSFNYTLTLERLYSIPSERILHIHGKFNEEYILGHNNNKDVPFPHPENIQMDNRGDVVYGDDFRTIKVKEKINDIYENIHAYYYKNSEQLIKDYSDFFKQFEYADKIIFMGFSMGPVDLKYIEEIAKRIKPYCDIEIYYHENITDEIMYVCQTYFNKNYIVFIEW